MTTQTGPEVRLGETPEQAVLLERLDEILDQEIRLHEDLLASLGSSRDHIISRRIEQLAQASNRQEIIAGKIAELEHARASTVSELAIQSGLGSEPEITLRYIAGHTAEPFAPRFSELLKRLVGVVQQVASANQVNTRLINYARGYTQLLRSAIFGPEHDVYTAKGGTRKIAHTRSLLDHRT